MAERLTFHLVSPERELFAGEVDQVIVPGTDGDFGVLPNHAPLMSTIRAGGITVIDGGQERRVFIRGGFADVTPSGLTILAEEAIDVGDIDMAAVEQELRDCREDLADATDDAARRGAEEAIARLEAMKATKEAG